MASVEEVARGLSEAQRRMIIAARSTMFETHWVMVMRDRWSTKIIMNLRKKGLSETDLLNRDKLTPLGLAARAHLLSQERD